MVYISSENGNPVTSSSCLLDKFKKAKSMLYDFFGKRIGISLHPENFRYFEFSEKLIAFVDNNVLYKLLEEGRHIETIDFIVLEIEEELNLMQKNKLLHYSILNKDGMQYHFFCTEEPIIERDFLLPVDETRNEILESYLQFDKSNQAHKNSPFNNSHQPQHSIEMYLKRLNN
ncbi:MAG: hypothetical protein QXG00_03720 [Candidatus Woesearchaeota archaeon]